MTVNTGNVTPGGGSPAYGYVKSADLTRPYNKGGSMSPKSFECSRYDDHEIQAILRHQGDASDGIRHQARNIAAIAAALPRNRPAG